MNSKNNNNSNNTLLVQMTKDGLMQDFEQVVRKVVNQMQEQQASKNEKLTYTRDETAEILNVTLKTLHNWNKQRIFKPSTKVGKRVLF
ncbi:hypothetical protein CQ046_05235 [Chryseobacterium sp. MYb7]|jgi:DNA-binding transcriptional regulator YiaG|uniref:helix-turn-helix domain-containing protein n=1 Tax=Chryseobacterium sp. MYb7 TaxID=1827290 RepID=UPI000CFE7B7E|nr:helix-turn-helix domain-containing protein [Chryseobacterium sp. MYb7]PRB05266.1 hypothetical protein CQ046_05235 [Chryseobacterium sp. MYb7]